MKYVSSEILWTFWNIEIEIFLKIFQFWYYFFWNSIKFLKFWTFLKILIFWKFGNFITLLPIIINIYWIPSLPMVFWPPYPWYIDPLSHGISTPPTHGIHKYHKENWTRGQNIIGKSTRVQFTMGFKIPYDTGTRE